jgi:hypothetical protein
METDKQGPGVYSFVPDKRYVPFFTDENTKRPITTDPMLYINKVVKK